MRKLCFVKHKSFQKKMKDLLLRSQIQKYKGRKRSLRIKFRMHLRKRKVHQKNRLMFLLPKGDLLGTEKRYKKARSIKLLPGLSEKA